MRWLWKIVQVFVVIGLGAFAALPFRRLPSDSSGSSSSADRIVLQNDSPRAVQETPLQIAPPPTPVDRSGDHELLATTSMASDEPRTASNRPAQASRKDLPAWNSKLEVDSPPPVLPDSFAPAVPRNENRPISPIVAPEDTDSSGTSASRFSNSTPNP